MSKLSPILPLVCASTLILSGSLKPATANEISKQIEQQVATRNSISTTKNIDSVNSALDTDTPKEDTRIDLVKSPKNSAIYLIPQKVSQTTPEGNERDITEPDAPETDPEGTLLPGEDLERGIPEDSELDKLNPDPNLLNIPKTPEGVEINIDEPITLEDAIKLALLNNTDIRDADLNLDRSQRELQQARAALYPTLGVNSQYQFSNTAQAENSTATLRESSFTNPLSDVEDNGTAIFTGSLRLEYDIYTGGNRGADIRRAKKQVEFNQLNLETVTEQTVFEAKRDYYALQDADSQVEIEQAAVEDASQTLRDAQLLEEAGLGTRFDVLRAEVELANAQQRLNSANAAQATARRQLVETLSLGEQVTIQTADDITKAGEWELAIEESILAAYENRAELEQFLVNREINQAQRDIALSNIRPQLSIFGEYDFFEETGDGIETTTGYAIGATLQWTIFDGGVAKAIARQEDIDVLLADNGFANQRNQVRLEVEQAFFGLEANEENITTAQKAEELAEESLRLARLRFQAGVGTQTDVIEAQTELTTARGNLLTAVIDYNQSFNELQRAITGEFSGDFEVRATPAE